MFYCAKQAVRTPTGGDVRGCWCHPCFSEAKEGLVQLDGSTVVKRELEKRKNGEEVSPSPSSMHAAYIEREAHVMASNMRPVNS